MPFDCAMTATVDRPTGMPSYGQHAPRVAECVTVSSSPVVF